MTISIVYKRGFDEDELKTTTTTTTEKIDHTLITSNNRYDSFDWIILV
jgi:hypothetical protein